MMKSIPFYWEETSLQGLLFVLETGSRPKGGVSRFTEGIPSIGGEHLTSTGRFNFEKLKYIPEDFAKTLSRGKISRGDVLIVKDGATTGKCVWVSEDFPFTVAFVNEHVFLCRFWPFLDSRFFAYFLRSDDGKKRILSNFRGAAQGGITRAFASNTFVPVAPLNEQKRIGDKLDTLLKQVDTCREHLGCVPQIIERFRQSVLAAAVSGRLTEEWRAKSRNVEGYPDYPWDTVVLMDVCEEQRVITYGVIKLGHDIPDGIPCLRTSNVRWLKIDTEGMKSIDPSVSEKYSRTILKGGEVLVNVRGTLGGVAIVPPEMAGWNVSREVAVVPINPEKVIPQFVAYWIGSVSSQQWLGRVEKGVAYIGINLKDLRNLPIMLPSIPEQQEIIHRVDKLFACADRLEERYLQARDYVELITLSLLAKAFRGELVPQDTNDEPVSLLLERIRAEQATAQADKPKRVSRSSKPRRIKMSEESVKKVIQELPTDKFSFDALSVKFPGNYEGLKEIIFNLLSADDPIITQVFDQSVQALRFVRRVK